MPYLTPNRRKELQDGKLPEVAGDINYLVTTLVDMFIFRHGPSYSVYNEVIGALECCKLELYRRKIADYEDSKIKQNGDAFLC